jgi:hypothetical protein
MSRSEGRKNQFELIVFRCILLHCVMQGPERGGGYVGGLIQYVFVLRCLSWPETPRTVSAVFTPHNTTPHHTTPRRSSSDI